VIQKIEFSDESLVPGGVRFLRAWSDQPLMVWIECFRQPPSPAQPRPCPECGEFRVRDGERIQVKASTNVFRDGGGFLRVVVRDKGGDERIFEIAVTKITEDKGTPAYG
jgi:hypothetical protein